MCDVLIKNLHEYVIHTQNTHLNLSYRHSYTSKKTIAISREIIAIIIHYKEREELPKS